MDAETIVAKIDPVLLGQKLRTARKRKGMTQEQAAAIIDAARTTLLAIEQGNRRIKPEELVLLVFAYECDLVDFVHIGTELDSVLLAQIEAPDCKTPNCRRKADPDVGSQGFCSACVWMWINGVDPIVMMNCAKGLDEYPKLIKILQEIEKTLRGRTDRFKEEADLWDSYEQYQVYLIGKVEVLTRAALQMTGR